MRVETITDPQTYLERTSVLLADEARHNLMRGILGTLVRSPEVYPAYRLFAVEEDRVVVAAALITAPFSLVVADAADDSALAELVAAVVADGVDVPGVIGNHPTVVEFVAAWEEATGTRATLQMAQGVFALEEVQPIPRPAGRARPAGLSDLEIVEGWTIAFMAEALPHEDLDAERTREMVARRLGGGDPSGFWLWEIGGVPVSLSSHGSPTGTGIRVGPVYTPPECRRKGYASGLVADQSQRLLDDDYRFCFLYADLANPTSTQMYERIGYRRVAEAASYGFA